MTRDRAKPFCMFASYSFGILVLTMTFFFRPPVAKRRKSDKTSAETPNMQGNWFPRCRNGEGVGPSPAECPHRTKVAPRHHTWDRAGRLHAHFARQPQARPLRVFCLSSYLTNYLHLRALRGGRRAAGAAQRARRAQIWGWDYLVVNYLPGYL